jgi:hypothetical protein
MDLLLLKGMTPVRFWTQIHVPLVFLSRKASSTPLSFAAYSGHADCALLLLKLELTCTTRIRRAATSLYSLVVSVRKEERGGSLALPDSRMGSRHATLRCVERKTNGKKWLSCLMHTRKMVRGGWVGGICEWAGVYLLVVRV